MGKDVGRSRTKGTQTVKIVDVTVRLSRRTVTSTILTVCVPFVRLRPTSLPICTMQALTNSFCLDYPERISLLRTGEMVYTGALEVKQENHADIMLNLLDMPMLPSHNSRRHSQTPQGCGFCFPKNLAADN